MKIGFDISMTHQQKAGCGWVAEKLSKSLALEHVENSYVFFDHFIGWINDSVEQTGIALPQNVSAPLRRVDKSQAHSYWENVRRTGICEPKVDIIHSNNFQACRFANTKLVYTVYDVSFWVHPEFTTEANRLACQSGLLDALLYADGLVYISEHARIELHRILPGAMERQKIKECVLPLGPAHQPSKDSLQVGKEAYWLMVGSLEPRKNHQAALDAFEIYWQKSQRKIPLKIAGGAGWKSEKLQKRISHLKEQGKLDYLGYTQDEHMRDLYHNAMALLFPSWHEGFGLPVLEAMGLGCPVISSSTASLPEVGGDAVAYIDPAHPEQIAEEMLRIENAPDLRQAMIQKGREQAEHFSWKKSADRLMEFYEELVEAK